MTMYFGRPWNPNIRNNGTQIPAPVDGKCCWCDEKIQENDQGLAVPCGSIDKPPPEPVVYYHLDCFLRTLCGSVGHLQRPGPCDEICDDPPNMTRRQAATAAVKLWEQTRA